MTIKLTTDKAAVVDTQFKWIPITTLAPKRGAKCLVINRKHVVARLDIWTPESDASHWAPLPTFFTDEDDAEVQ